MYRIWFAALCAALILCRASQADAVDLYTVFDASCKQTTGILVHVDEKRVLLIELSGTTAAVPRQDIHSLVLHNLLENPLPVIELSGELKRYLRDVWMGDDGKPTFSGWATGFFDDLLIFADIDGKTHIVDPEDVAKMRDSALATGPHRPAVYASTALAFPPELVPCAKAPPTAGSLPPSRVVADRIKLGGVFTKLEEAYRQLDGFEERTWVYAKPFVFDPDSRVGLFYHQDSPIQLPIYFRWSSGRPYRFQSQTTIGMTIHEWLPTTSPSFSVASNTKSHFFNASFVGNVAGLPAGSNAFLFDELSGEDGARRNVEVTVGYNYLILMGVDYWRLSLAAGPAYLATRIATPGGGRNVSAEAASPAFRLLYLGSRLNLRALYYHTRMSGDAQTISNDAIGTYHLRADAVRVGATVAISDEIAIDLDHIVTIGTYREGDDMQSSQLEYLHLDTGVAISSSFGRYVTVRGYLRHFLRRYEFDALADDSRNETKFGAALEFLF